MVCSSYSYAELKRMATYPDMWMKKTQIIDADADGNIVGKPIVRLKPINHRDRPRPSINIRHKH